MNCEDHSDGDCTHLNGELHSFDDLPAYSSKIGIYEWYKHGKLHRDGDKPAVITDDYQEWYKDDMIYRENGPAIVYSNGKQVWCRNDEYYREDDLPTCVSANYQAWHDAEGDLHRENDLPAVIMNDGTKMWYVHGIRHRCSGPVIIRSNGNAEWYICGEFLPIE